MDFEIPRWFQILALAGLLAASAGCLVWGIVTGDWADYVAAAMPLPMAGLIVWCLRNDITQPFKA